MECQKHINDRISASYVRDQMLCQIQYPEEQNEMLRDWSEDINGNYAGIRQFAKKMASQWFRTNFCKDGFCGSGYDLDELRTSFKEWIFFFELEYEEYEAALLYAYWLFFSGMALVYADGFNVLLSSYFL